MVMYRKRKCKYRRETWQPCGDLLSRKWYSYKGFWVNSPFRVGLPIMSHRRFEKWCLWLGVNKWMQVESTRMVLPLSWWKYSTHYKSKRVSPIYSL